MVNAGDFVGQWQQVKSENFEEYMKAAGVGLLARKAAANITVTLEFKIDGDTWTVNQISTFKNTTTVFKMGEEFDETTPDGRKFKTTVTVQDGKVVQRQKALKSGDAESTITRYVENGVLYTVLECGGVTCRREYTKKN